MLLGGFAASQAGYLDWVWPQGSGTRLVADNMTAQLQDTAPSQPAAGTPSSAGPASQPVPSAATALPRNTVKVDESALRYFAAKGDTKRLDAEIARLRALYPQWTPPANPLAVENTDDPQLDAMWKLYSDGKLTELRKAIADRQTAEPGWQAPADLLDRLAVAESREQLVNASNLKQYDAVIRIGSVTPSSRCIVTSVPPYRPSPPIPCSPCVVARQKKCSPSSWRSRKTACSPTSAKRSSAVPPVPWPTSSARWSRMPTTGS
ncbi:MAG: hypothetical protein J0I55_16200 [Mesorhizobium sp.]|nr:hypothetical protein [Mesorhizobium sp.]